MKSILLFTLALVGASACADYGQVDFYSPTSGYGEVRELHSGRLISILKPDLLDSGVSFLWSGECVSFTRIGDHVRNVSEVNEDFCK